MLVAAVFVAIKLWPAAARALEHALTLVHVRGRIWCDATDLLALVVLPVAWSLTGWRARTAPPAGVARRAFERAAVIAGALACLATTTTVPGPLPVLLVNRTQTAQEVAVYRLLAAAEPRSDCAALEAGDLSRLVRGRSCPRPARISNPAPASCWGRS